MELDTFLTVLLGLFCLLCVRVEHVQPCLRNGKAPVIPSGATRLYSSAPQFGASGRAVEGSWHNVTTMRPSCVSLSLVFPSSGRSWIQNHRIGNNA
jgi:hypothetical protein